MKSFKCIQTLCLVISLSCVTCELNLPEGSACVTEGLNGTCLSVYKCTTAANAYIYREAGYPEDKLPELAEICSYKDKTPIVCCADCTLNDEEVYKDNVVNINGYLVKKEGPKAYNKCLDYIQHLPYKCRGGNGNLKIIRKLYEREQCYGLQSFSNYGIGGRVAERWELPHMALLGFGEDQPTAKWVCGGSVISEKFILTAAHCVYSRLLGYVSFAALGILKRSDPLEYWKVYKIKRAIEHPEYKPPSHYHDIALLETETEISFSEELVPACLDTEHLDKSEADAPGWGEIGYKNGLADTLQVLLSTVATRVARRVGHDYVQAGNDKGEEKAFDTGEWQLLVGVIEVSKYNKTDCASAYPTHRHLKQGYDHTTQMCYGSHSDIIDTCQGDSGGPLQVNLAKCQYTVVGVTSFGRTCGTLGTPGMYTRVSHYVPWIESIVWPD